MKFTDLKERSHFVLLHEADKGEASHLYKAKDGRAYRLAGAEDPFESEGVLRMTQERVDVREADEVILINTRPRRLSMGNELPLAGGGRRTA